MALSMNKCRTLKARIDKLENALDDYLTGNRALTITDGPESVNFQAGTGIPAGIRRRIEELKRAYAAGQCASVLDCNDVDVSSPRTALRPMIGHN